MWARGRHGRRRRRGRAVAAATAHLSQVERYCWRVVGFGRVPLRLPGWLLLVLELHSLRWQVSTTRAACCCSIVPQIANPNADGATGLEWEPCVKCKSALGYRCTS